MKVAILDFDLTLYRGYARYELGFLMEKHGMIANGFTDEINKLQNDYEEGKITYNKKFADDKAIFSKYYKDLKRIDVEKFMKANLPLRDNIHPWAPELIAIMQDHGFLIVVISGCWDFILEEAQEILNFDTFFCSSFETKNGVLTGEYSQILDEVKKRHYSKEVLKNAEFSIGVGDSVADFEFLQMVNRAFLFEPKPDAEQAAEGKDFILTDRDSIVEDVMQVLK